MQIFLDSASLDEIRLAEAWGWIDGVTTNPTLVAATGKNYDELLREIISATKGLVSAEVIATDKNGMLAQARFLSQLGKQVVVKLPCTTEGLAATRVLSQEKIKTNVTLIFSLSQGLLAAKAGATYCSPFVGRLEDQAPQQGEELLSHLRTVYDDYHFQTKIIAASMRHLAHFESAVGIGVDAVTAPLHILEKLSKHHLTDLGLQKFLDDWHRANQKFPI